MSQQYNKVIKRRRRNAYLKRKNTAAKARKKVVAAKPRPAPQAQAAGTAASTTPATA